MNHMETSIVPVLAEMTIEEKWDRLHDFFTMDHAISYKTHKRMGTVQAWVDDTVEAYGKMMGRFDTRSGNFTQLTEPGAYYHPDYPILP